MPRITYGYRVVNGEIQVDDAAATKIRALFDARREGLSAKKAGEKAGLNLDPTSLLHMLKNRAYAGENGYPAIVDASMLDDKKKRTRRASPLPPAIPVAERFRVTGKGSISGGLAADRAAAAYDLLEPII